MAKVNFYLKDSDKPEKHIFAKFHFKYSEVDSAGKKKFKFLKYYINVIQILQLNQYHSYLILNLILVQELHVLYLKMLI